MRFVLPLLTLFLAALPGCRYAELSTPHGTARYLRLDLSTKHDKIQVTTSSGAALHVEGATSSSQAAIDALAKIAKP